MFRGWRRLCLKPRSVSVPEGASLTPATLGRTDQADAAGKEANVSTGKTAASAEVVVDSERTKQETARGSMLVAKLKLKVKDTEQALQKQNLRRTKILVRIDVRVT